MISIDALRDHLSGRWVVFDKNGTILEREVPGDAGPATLLVSEVTEALKRVDQADRIVESVDRSRMWKVDAIVLSESVLSGLAGEMAAADLLDAVRSTGHEWQVIPTSDL